MEEFNPEEMKQRLAELIAKHSQLTDANELAEKLINDGVIVPPVLVGTKIKDTWMGDQYVLCLNYQVTEDKDGHIHHFGEIYIEDEADRGNVISCATCRPWYDK